jgi:hypothetical protein
MDWFIAYSILFALAALWLAPRQIGRAVGKLIGKMSKEKAEIRDEKPGN